MENTSDDAFRNWGKGLLLPTLAFPLLNVYKDQRLFKAKGVFYFVKFHVYVIVYKMHKNNVFLSSLFC